MEDKTKRKLNVCLFAMLGNDDLVNRWWESPNRAFDGKTPSEVFEVDRQEVINYVLSHLQR
jgi:hypothetical protein